MLAQENGTFQQRLFVDGGHGVRDSLLMATANIAVGDKTIYEAEVTEVGPNAYRLEEELGLFFATDGEELLSIVPRFGDVIETAAGANGALLFVRVLERGAYRHYEAAITKEAAGSEHLDTLLDEVISEGGQWQSIFGGFLFVSLPETSTMDFNARFAATDLGS